MPTAALQLLVGQLDPHAAVELRLPPPGHRGRVRERAGFGRADPLGPEAHHRPQRRPVRDRVQERADEPGATVLPVRRTGRRTPRRS